MVSAANAVLTVDLSVIRNNIRIILSEAKGCRIIPVLKADAYGFGMIRVATAIEDLPSVACFAVAQVPEGLKLREGGIRKDILILGEPLPFQMDAALKNGLTLTAGRVSDIATYAASAQKLGMKMKVQIKFDTGLHRIGIEKESIQDLIETLNAAAPVIELAGVYSHFRDPGNAALCKSQFLLFTDCCDRLSRAGFHVPLRHIADSAGSERYPKYALDAVRIGRRLYFDAPSGHSGKIREAASLRSYILDVQPRAAHTKLGYGDGITLEKDADVAVIGIGYGDGLPPSCAESGMTVLIRQKRCRVLWCFMDQCLVDVTGIGAKPGDSVTLFGSDGYGNSISAQEQASVTGAPEGCGLTSLLSPRVARIYR